MNQALLQNLEQLTDIRALQDAFRETTQRPKEAVSIVFMRSGARHALSTPWTPDFTAETRVEVGCIAKTLTAMLVAMAVREGRIDLEEPLSRCLGLERADYFGTVRVRELLNHSHGFDPPRLKTLPLRADGLIETSTILQSLRRTSPIAEPGVIFNYSDIGYWLVAAILEARYRLPFASLLREKLFALAGISTELNEHVCPGTGRGIRLSALEIARLAEVPDEHSGHPLIDELTTWCGLHGLAPMPWPGLGDKVGPGWIDFGGSFGYSGKGNQGSAVMRIVSEPRTIVVVTAANRNAAKYAFTLMFGRFFADCGAQPPAPMSPADWLQTDSEPYLGRYENSQYSVAVDLGAHRALRLRAFRKEEDGAVDSAPYFKRYLKPMTNDRFLPQMPEPIAFPLIVFSDRRTGSFQFLSTGMHVFARSGEPQTRQA